MKELYITQELFNQLHNMLCALYVSAVISTKEISIDELSDNDVECAEDYARAKVRGILSEIEPDGYEWRIILKKE